MAVLAIVAAMLLPALSRAKEKGRRTACVNNMRQIGVALRLYADDQEGWLPTTTHGAGTNDSWIFQLSPYVANVNDIRICPSDKQGEQRLTNNASSYTQNEYVFVDYTDPFGKLIESYRRLDMIRNLALTITTFEISDSVGVSVMNDHTHSRNWLLGWSAVQADIQPDRHGRGANYLFADSHVEFLNAALLKKRIEAGDNFAKPPQ